MTDKYDSNGDYYGDNFRRDKNSKGDADMTGDSEENNLSSQKATEYVRELLAEKLELDQVKSPNAARLIDQEVTKVQQIGKAPLRENKYVDIYREKPIKVTVKVLVPVREHPKFNFVGKLLGPKGNSMKRLQEETMCKMAVLGRGSMKDRQKEEELRNSLDPKYSHLTDDLHVEISALGPPAEAHARVAFALAEVRKYLIPDNNDIIRQEQMREMEVMTVDHHGGHGGERAMRPRRPPPPMMRSMEESYGYEEEPYEQQNAPSYDYNARQSYGGGSNQYDAGYEEDYYRPNSSSYDYDREDYDENGGRWSNKTFPEPTPSRTWKPPYKSGPAPSGRHMESSRYRSSPYARPSK